MHLFNRIMSTDKAPAEMAAELEKAAERQDRAATGHHSEAARLARKEADWCRDSAKQLREQDGRR